MIRRNTPRADRPRIAVLTLVSGEHDHLLSHVDGLSVSTWPPDIHVVTSIRDPAVTRGRVPIESDRWSTEVPVLPLPPSRDAFLPGLHAAGRTALEGGADVLVFLSVSCIPSHRLLQILTTAAVSGQSATPTLCYTAVDGLAPAPPVGYPVAGDLDAFLADPTDTCGPTGVSAGRWSSSFAMTARDWRLVLPKAYTAHPYDGSPTDVEDVIIASSGRIRPVTGATAYRQHPLRQEVPEPATA